MSINSVHISGNLTRDSELKVTNSGSPLLVFSVAVNDRHKNQQTGEWEDVPNFIDCMVFGNRAEALSRHLFKGTKVTIEGKLRWSQWERDGQKRSKLEVVVGEIEFMSRQSQGEAKYGAAGAQVAQSPTYGTGAPNMPSQSPTQPIGTVEDEYIPF